VGLVVLRDVEAFQYGTSPNKFFDYLAAGLPIGVNHRGWLADMLAENKCGYSCDAGSADDLAAMIEKFLSLNKVLRCRMSDSTRELAERFSRTRLIRAQAQLCSEVAGQHGEYTLDN
jgi:glycosyltransferase involved in cell wall biosynthesis